jgi:UDP-glucose 4-epimerase
MALDEEFWRNPIEVYNIGSEDQTNVLTIAKVVTDAMSLQNVATSVAAKPGERAWPGDIRTMLLDVSKIKRRGWKPKRNSDEAIRTAAVELVRELNK